MLEARGLARAPLPSLAPARTRRGRRRATRPAAAVPDGPGPSPGTPEARRQRGAQQPQRELSLENMNPISLGRETRKVFDDVWQQLQRIGNPAARREIDDDAYRVGPAAEFESPRAASTTVLVVGATGRVGRVLVRKLLLRGYRVRALVRQRTGEGGAGGSDTIPQSVQQVVGDVGDYASCRAAVEGADKVIVCSGARSTITADLDRVENQGVANLARAFLDARNARARREGHIDPSTKKEVVDFRRDFYHPLWNIEFVGLPAAAGSGKDAAKRRRGYDRAQDTAECRIDEDHQLVFEGAVYTRNGVAQVGGGMKLLRPRGDARRVEVGAPLERPFDDSLAGCEALVLRVRGDGNPYTLLLTTAGGHTYASRFQTRDGYATVRLPFGTFVPVDPGAAPPGGFDPAEVARLALRFESRREEVVASARGGGGGGGGGGDAVFGQAGHRFRMAVDYIKAAPGGEETDFVLVSCAGAPRPGMSAAAAEKVLAYKRRGEAHLRNSGLGYTVVRPGPLVEEAGGYKASASRARCRASPALPLSSAMIFDQGSRITESIACADVADVCLKALHDRAARNISFDVCQEYQPEEGLQSYELIAHLPDRMNGYLTPALVTLQHNT
eukprot:scaffold25.g5130.t1